MNEQNDFEEKLDLTLNSISASPDLKQCLLDLPNAKLKTTDSSANTQWFWNRALLPVAASLLIAIGLALSYWPKTNPLEQEIFAHIYREASFLEVKTVLPFTEVKELMQATLGSKLQLNSELAELKVHVIDDCWVAKENAIHMVVTGNTGPVTVLMIPNSPVDEEYLISDELLEGLITPTPTGNIVVVGEKGETLSEYSRLLANNISW